MADSEEIFQMKYGLENTTSQFPPSGFATRNADMQAKVAADILNQQAGQKRPNSIYADRPTEEILAERGSQYGDFHLHAQITQKLKREFVEHLKKYNPEGYKQYLSNPAVREGVDMIFHKLGRAANGNIMLKDTWDDTAGYAKLVSKECEF